MRRPKKGGTTRDRPIGLQSDTVLVLMPAYNEERALAATVAGVRQALPDAAVLVVDDGSTDKTAAVARAAGAMVASLPYNSGYGVALQVGYQFAARAEYPLVVQIDADGQHKPASIPHLLRPLLEGHADVVIGSRFLGERSYRVPLLRRVGMALFRGLIRLLSKRRLTDPTSGFQAIRGDVVRALAGRGFPEDFPDADVLLMLHYRGFRITEVPVAMSENAEHKSMHHGVRPAYYLFKMLLSIVVVLIRHGLSAGRVRP